MRKIRETFLIVVAASVAFMSINETATATHNVKPRTAESAYRTPVLGTAVGSGNKAYYFDCLKQIGCTILPVKPKERYVDLEIADAAGGRVYGAIYAMPGGDFIDDFCGTTERPLFVRGIKELLVHVISGTCPNNSISTATTGVVRATFTRRAR